jgi:hypothetical protein
MSNIQEGEIVKLSGLDFDLEQEISLENAKSLLYYSVR